MAQRPILVTATRLAAWVLALAAVTPLCRAACIPLADPGLTAMDQLAEAYPERGAAAADAELHRPTANRDALRRAQLYAVVAQARSDEGRTADAHEAVVASLASLMDPAPAPVVASLRARLAIADHINAESTGELIAAVAALTDQLGRFAAPSVERGCLLAARSELYTEQLQLDAAASDATSAYAIAASHPWPAVRAAASVALGALYRRSGLPIDAQRMYDESLDYFRRQGAESQVQTLSYFRAQALADQGRQAEALAEFEEVRAASARIGDEMGVAIASLPICDQLIRLGRLAQADRECAAGLAQFRRYGRQDLQTLITASQAEIDVAMHRPRAALAKYGAVLAGGEHEVLPVELARWYRGRSRAYAALGQPAAALEDLVRADALEHKHDLDQRARAALAVKAIADAQQQAVRERALQERIAAQARELSSRTTIHRLTVALALLAVAVAAILAGFLWLSRRHARVIRRQAAILRSATAHAPDALVLLDADWRVLYANRGLLGAGTGAPAGTPLLAALPEPGRTAIEGVMRQVCADPAPRTVAVTVLDPGAAERMFDVWVLPVLEGSRVDRLLLRSFDVTQLRALEREVAGRSSLERDRLSGDMHEGLGQELSGIAMMIGALAQSAALDDDGARQQLCEIGLQLRHAVQLTAELARGVSPVRTTRGMLGPALRRLAGEVGARTGCEVVTRCELEERELAPLMTDQVYQIASDAIAYAAPRSARVDVELSARPGALRLAIGCRYRTDADADAAGEERLLALLAHRASLIGGGVSAVTTGEGARLLTLTAPLVAEPPTDVDPAAVATRSGE